jgi:hypothetical protein
MFVLVFLSGYQKLCKKLGTSTGTVQVKAPLQVCGNYCPLKKTRKLLEQNEQVGAIEQSV